MSQSTENAIGIQNGLHRDHKNGTGATLSLEPLRCALSHQERDSLWEVAVREAGSLRLDDVINALDHARIEQGPGGAAEMVPGLHHAPMNVYIALARNGKLDVLENLGVIDPDEAMVSGE